MSPLKRAGGDAISKSRGNAVRTALPAPGSAAHLQRAAVGAVAVVVAHAVLPPLDLALLEAAELGRMGDAVIGLGAVADHLAHPLALGRVAGDPIEARARVDDEQEVAAEVAALALLDARGRRN